MGKKLTDEIVGDPLLRGYSGMTDQALLDDGYTFYRPSPNITIQTAMDFLLMENTYKVGDGDDTQDRSIWQRMKEVVGMSTSPSQAIANPWGSISLGNITEIQQVKVHQLHGFFTLSAQGNLPITLTDSNFKVYLAGAESAGCMSAAQKAAFLALADNLQTRWGELGLAPKLGQIERARA
jgi:hypothetical protein